MESAVIAEIAERAASVSVGASRSQGRQPRGPADGWLGAERLQQRHVRPELEQVAVSAGGEVELLHRQTDRREWPPAARRPRGAAPGAAARRPRTGTGAGGRPPPGGRGIEVPQQYAWVVSGAPSAPRRLEREPGGLQRGHGRRAGDGVRAPPPVRDLHGHERRKGSPRLPAGPGSSVRSLDVDVAEAMSGEHVHDEQGMRDDAKAGSRGPPALRAVFPHEQAAIGLLAMTRPRRGLDEHVDRVLRQPGHRAEEQESGIEEPGDPGFLQDSHHRLERLPAGVRDDAEPDVPPAKGRQDTGDVGVDVETNEPRGMQRHAWRPERVAQVEEHHRCRRSQRAHATLPRTRHGCICSDTPVVLSALLFLMACVWSKHSATRRARRIRHFPGCCSRRWWWLGDDSTGGRRVGNPEWPLRGL